MIRMPGILGKKLGMTQIFDEEGRRVPVTVIQAGPCPVLQVKTEESDGYNAVQLGFDGRPERTASKPAIGHAKKAGTGPKRFVRELRTEGAPEQEPGSEVRVDVFEGIELLDVTGTSKGKGFQGGMKRWNFGGGRASHGASRFHRRPGGIGRTYGTNKGIPKGKHMAGHMGAERVTARAELVRIDPENDLLLLRGAVPGPNGGYLVIRRSIAEESRKARLARAKASSGKRKIG